MAFNAQGQYYYDPQQDQGANPQDPFLSPLAPEPGISYQNSQDPRTIAQNQRALISQTGNRLLDQNAILAQQGEAGYNAIQGGFLNPIEQNLAQGGGGYTPDEQSKIQTSPEQLAQNFLTPQEQAEIKGDPSQMGRFFNPDALSGSLQQSQEGQATAAAQLQAGLQGSIDPNALQQSQDYQAKSQGQLGSNSAQFLNVLNAMGNNVRGAQGTEAGVVGGAQGAEAGNVRGAIDPGALKQSATAAQNEVMTPEEEARMVTGAGISAGVRNSAAVGDLQRAALAAGSSPEGVAAYRQRMGLQSGAQAADAMTQARIAAQEARAQEALGSESQRLGGQQFLTGTQVGAEENLGAQDVASKLRMGTEAQAAEQNMGAQALAGQEALGQQALTQGNLQEANRQAAQQFLTGANLQAATTGGEAQLQQQELATGQTQQQGQYNATTGTQIASAEEQAAQQRASQLAQNRQATQTGNEATQSSQATNVGQTRIGQQNVGLGLQAGAAQTQNTNAQNAYGRQNTVYGTQTSGTNQAAGLGLAASQTPTTTDKVLGGVAGALGAASQFIKSGDVITKPTLGVVGEEPEMIVPIESGYRSSLKPQRQGFQTQEALRPKRRNYQEAA